MAIPAHQSDKPTTAHRNLAGAFLLLLCLLCPVQAQVEAHFCRRLPLVLQFLCRCEASGSIKLDCKGVNTTRLFLASATMDPNSVNFVAQLPVEPIFQYVEEIRIRDSQIECADLLHDFEPYTRLKRLSVVRSRVKALGHCNASLSLPEHVHRGAEENNNNDLLLSADKNSPLGRTLSDSSPIEILDLSENELVDLDTNVFSTLIHLRELNVSHNSLGSLAVKLLSHLKNFRLLDISYNNLDVNLPMESFTSLPSTLSYIDISHNAWSCSPKLSWMFNWSRPLIENKVLQNDNTTRCQYEGSTHDAKLLLVMEYYVLHVLPSCPIRDGCHCQLENIQEKIVVSTERHYTVYVSCANKALKYFPKMPKHTKTVDLSGNQLDDDAFDILKVSEHNYGEVENLTLSRNRLESLPEKLLDMKLGISFSAKNNNLQSISYDFSQRLIKTTNVIELSGNPWMCTCSSQITDLNLIAKVRDKSAMLCGASSEMRLHNKKISELEPDQLCPPDTNGESQELLLQLLCGLLAILIVIILAKLSYDTWIYRTRGELPWLVLKMP